MLRNPYYMGVVVYRGRRVPNGRHPRLVEPDTFDQVQALLAARAVAGDRPYKHQHYLRGTVYCAECGGRLLYGRHRGNGGLYEYFGCINRLSRKGGRHCSTSHYPVAMVERAVEDHYRTIRLTKKVRENVYVDVRRDASERAEIIRKDMERHERRIKKLEANQARLVQMSYDGLVSDEVLASEQQRLEVERLQAQRLLDATAIQAQDVESALDGALAKTSTPQATYLASTPFERRLLNQAFFTRILVGEDSEITGTTLTPVYTALAIWEPQLGKPKALEAHYAPVPASQEDQRTNPDPVFRGQSSYVEPMVERTVRCANPLGFSAPALDIS
jgi:site-specific DNA recombinase